MMSVLPIARAARMALCWTSCLLLAAMATADVSAGERDASASAPGQPPFINLLESESVRMMVAQKLRRPLGSIPETVVSVKEVGGHGDGLSDDVLAIERAILSARHGGIILFPAGTYVQSRSIRVNAPNVVLLGVDARLHAPNPMDQALGLVGQGSALLGLTLTAVPSRVRATDLPQTRIVIAGVGNAAVDNVIDGASAAGIMVFGGRDFRIEGNIVRNTLADGIHMTNGANGGVVLRNQVRESHDDMVAVVSYGKAKPAHNILIARNDLAGNPWGRGIAVVGGNDITVSDNLIRDVRAGAGVLIAREGVWNTNGSSNIVIERNLLEQIQTGGEVLAGLPRTGQGAIEIFSDGKSDRELAVRTVLIRENEIRVARGDGVRMIGSVCQIELVDNRFSGLGGAFLQASSASCLESVVSCRGNRRDGAPVSAPPCGSLVSGANGAAVRE